MPSVVRLLIRIGLDAAALLLGGVTAVWVLLVPLAVSSGFTPIPAGALLALLTLRLLVPLEWLRLRLVGVRVTPSPVPEHLGRFHRAVRVVVGPIDGDDVTYLLLHGVLGLAAGVIGTAMWGAAVLGVLDGGWARLVPGAPGGEPWIRIGSALILVPLAAVICRRLATGQGAVARWRLDGPARRRLSDVLASRAKAVKAQATELERIERDLHDGAQARIVALAMHLGAAHRALRMVGDEADRARVHLLAATDTAAAALADLRRLVRGMAPPVLADRGLVAALRVLAADSVLPVTVDVDPALERADAVTGPVAHAVYFTAAEALTNAAKHAAATRAVVILRRGRDHLELTVRDDGTGGADPNGAGLTGLRHRVGAIDGTLSVGQDDHPAARSGPAGERSEHIGRGTVVRAVLPLGDDRIEAGQGAAACG